MLNLKKLQEKFNKRVKAIMKRKGPSPFITPTTELFVSGKQKRNIGGRKKLRIGNMLGAL